MYMHCIMYEHIPDFFFFECRKNRALVTDHFFFFFCIYIPGVTLEFFFFYTIANSLAPLFFFLYLSFHLCTILPYFFIRTLWRKVPFFIIANFCACHYLALPTRDICLFFFFFFTQHSHLFLRTLMILLVLQRYITF